MTIGNTRLVNIEGVYFKLEYENPTGSVKDRGIVVQLEDAIKKGFRKFSISSSGNAAISASYWLTQLGGEQLDVFVSPAVLKSKREAITKSSNVFIHETVRPNSDSFKLAKATGAYNLRASKDPVGFQGYCQIAVELEDQLPTIGSVFVPVSSATLLKGVGTGFKLARPQLHGVQSSSVNWLSGMFDKDKVEELSLADALVAKRSDLSEQATKLVSDSQGWGWTINNRHIIKAAQYLSDYELATSFEGAAALAAVWKAKEEGFHLADPVVCLLTGRKYN